MYTQVHTRRYAHAGTHTQVRTRRYAHTRRHAHAGTQTHTHKKHFFYGITIDFFTQMHLHAGIHRQVHTQVNTRRYAHTRRHADAGTHTHTPSSKKDSLLNKHASPSELVLNLIKKNKEYINKKESPDCLEGIHSISLFFRNCAFEDSLCPSRLRRIFCTTSNVHLRSAG